MRSLSTAALIIIAGAATLLSLTMGIRQSLGIVMAPLTAEIAITVSEFTFAIAMQNLIWGLTQPFIGALSVRTGFRPMMLSGALLYIGGLILLALAQGNWAVMLGALLFSERLEAHVFVALAVILAGVAVTQRAPSPKSR